MGLPIWKCPNCGKELPWDKVTEIESHDCFILLEEEDIYILDDPIIEDKYYE